MNTPLLHAIVRPWRTFVGGIPRRKDWRVWIKWAVGLLLTLVMLSAGIGLLLSYLWPYAFMLSASLKRMGEYNESPWRLLPHAPTLKNIVEIFTGPLGYWDGFKSSFFIATTHTLLVILLSSAAGFAFAKGDFPGRNKFFYFMILTMFIPSQATLVPSYLLIVRYLKGADHYWPLIVFAASAFNIFMMRQFMENGVPTEVIDAAKIDGANPIRIYWDVALPMVKGGAMALGFLTYLGSWNSFLWPTLVLPSNVEKWTLPLKVSKLLAMGWVTRDASGNPRQVPTDLPTYFAFGLCTTFPMLLVFIFAQRYLKTGILAGVFK